MFLELLNHILSFDLAWIAELIFGNLHWVFLLAAYVFFIHDGKKWFSGFILLVGSLYIALDLFAGLWGMNLLHAGIWLFIAIPLEIFIIGTIFDRHKNFTIWFAFVAASFIATFFVLG